jgi:hypothetical protein
LVTVTPGEPVRRVDSQSTRRRSHRPLLPDEREVTPVNNPPSAPDRWTGIDGRKRAVSDVISFILIFSLMIVSVGIVATVGIGILQDYRDAERVNSAEKVMMIAGEGIEEVAAGGSPRRTNELELRGGDLFVSDGADVAVRAGGTFYPTASNETGSLVYAYSSGRDSQFVYSSGLLLRQEGGGAVPLDGPRFICGEETATVQLVRIEAEGPSSVGGSTVRVEVQRNDTEVLFPSGPTSDVLLNVTTGVAEQDRAWRETLTRPQYGWTHVSDGTYRCSVDRATVTRTTVTVRFVS